MLETAVSLSAEILALKEERGWTWKEFAFHVNLVLGEKCPSETSLFRYAKGISTPTEEIEQIIFQAIRSIRNSQSTADESSGHVEANAQSIETIQTAVAESDETTPEQLNEVDAAQAEKLAAQVAELLTAYKEETGQTWVQIAAQVKSAFVGKAPSGSTLFRYSKSYTVPPVDIAQSLITALAKLQNSGPEQSAIAEHAQTVEAVAEPLAEELPNETAEVAVPAVNEHKPEESSIGQAVSTEPGAKEMSVAATEAGESHIEESSIGEAAIAESDVEEIFIAATAPDEPHAEDLSIAMAPAEIEESPLEDFYAADGVTPEDLEESNYWGPYCEFFDNPEASLDEEFGSTPQISLSSDVIVESFDQQPEPVFDQVVAMQEQAAIEHRTESFSENLSESAQVAPDAGAIHQEAILPEGAPIPEPAAVVVNDIIEKPALEGRSLAIALADALMDLKRATGWTWSQIAAALEPVMTGHVPSRAMLFQYARGLIEPEADLAHAIIEAVEKIQGAPSELQQTDAAPISAEPVAEVATEVVSEIAPPIAEILTESQVVPIAATETPMISEIAQSTAEVAVETLAQSAVETENQVIAAVDAEQPVAEIGAEAAPVAEIVSPATAPEEAQLADSFEDFAAIYEQWAAAQVETPVVDAEAVVAPDEQFRETLPADELAAHVPADEPVSSQLNGAVETAEEVLHAASEELEDPIIELIRNYKMALPSLVEPRLPDLSQSMEFSVNGHGYRPEEDELVMFCRSREIFFSQVPGEAAHR